MNVEPLYPYIGNVTDNTAICVPIDAFSKMMAASQAAFGEAATWYILAGVVIGSLVTLGILYGKKLIDERGE